MGGSESSAWTDKSGSEVCGGGSCKEAGLVTGTEIFLDLARIRCLVIRVTSTHVMTVLVQRNVGANLGVGTLALDGDHYHVRSMKETKQMW